MRAIGSFIETSDSTCALQLLSEKKPDLVLLDVNMPEVSGLDILNGIRADEALKHIPAIVLTGATDSATKLLALGLGATDVLGKPVDPSELALRVRNTLTAKAHQDRLLNFDELTGLPNRRLFMDRYAKALARAGEKSGLCALLLLGLDRFQVVNDSHGTEIGDALLTAFAAALEEHTRESDLPGLSGVDEEAIALSRVDGDEFALIIPNLPHAEISDLLSRRILSMLEKPFQVSGREVQNHRQYRHCRPSGRRRDDRCAVRECRGRHGGSQERRRQYLPPSLHGTQRQIPGAPGVGGAAATGSGAARAVSLNPNEGSKCSRVVSRARKERLRWKHATWGVVAPEKFLPIAEETGLIIPMPAQQALLSGLRVEQAVAVIGCRGDQVCR